MNFLSRPQHLRWPILYGLLGFLLMWMTSLPVYGQDNKPTPAADDQLKAKFVHKLNAIIEGSDAVVGVAVKDLNTGEEYVVNGDEIFPQASAIKIYILAEVFRQAEAGKFRLSDVRSVPLAARVGGSGVLSELDPSSVSMSIRDYATLMIVLSDNTATNLLIGLVGMDNVNASLRSLGAEKTRLQRVMMDSRAAAEGRENIGTPREVMMILEKMYRGVVVSKKASEEMLAILRKPKDGPLRSGVPEPVEVADKLGQIEGTRCDVGIVYLPGAPYVLCVMTKMLLRDSDGSKIITDTSRLVYEYLERRVNSNEYGSRIPR